MIVHVRSELKSRILAIHVLFFSSILLRQPSISSCPPLLSLTPMALRCLQLFFYPVSLIAMMASPLVLVGTRRKRAPACTALSLSFPSLGKSLEDLRLLVIPPCSTASPFPWQSSLVLVETFPPVHLMPSTHLASHLSPSFIDLFSSTHIF